MANTIDKAFVEQFKANVLHLAEQQGSRLRGTISEETVTGKQHNFDRVGNVAAVTKTTRHTDTPVLDVPHSRRRCVLLDYQWADMVDQEDKIRMLISPESAYARAGANALGKAMDSAIIAAATGNAVDGDGNNIALPAGQLIAAGGAGLTLAKVIQAKQIMDAADVDPDEDRFLVVSAAQIANLLNTTQATSSDYMNVKALVEGKIDTFIGFKVIRSQRVALAAGTRSCIAYARTGLGLAVGRDIVTKIDERSDKSYAMQVYLAMSIGAIRVEEEKVVKIDCTE